MTSSGSEGPKSRLSIHEVPDKISRIFFGDPKPGYGGSYGAPQGGQGYYPPVSPQNYYGSNRDIDYELLSTLGIVAMILWIVFAIVAILFMIFYCCVYCTRRNNNNNNWNRNEEDPYYREHGTPMPIRQSKRHPTNSNLNKPEDDNDNDELEAARGVDENDNHNPPPPPPSSSETNRSLPRSLPYYEVPTSHLTTTGSTHRPPPKIPTTPPPFQRFANRDISSNNQPVRKITTTETRKQSYIHSVGIPTSINGKLV